MTIFLICLIVIETLVLIPTALFAYKNAMTIFRVQDAIEESLDVLDKRYESISKILKVPLFYDSPEIKRAVEDIRKSRDAVLYVANQLTSIQEEENNNGNEENNQKG